MPPLAESAAGQNAACEGCLIVLVFRFYRFAFSEMREFVRQQPFIAGLALTAGTVVLAANLIGGEPPSAGATAQNSPPVSSALAATQPPLAAPTATPDRTLAPTTEPIPNLQPEWEEVVCVVIDNHDELLSAYFLLRNAARVGDQAAFEANEQLFKDLQSDLDFALLDAPEWEPASDLTYNLKQELHAMFIAYVAADSTFKPPNEMAARLDHLDAQVAKHWMAWTVEAFELGDSHNLACLPAT